MRILLAIVGFFIGLFLGIVILSAITVSTETNQMGNTFIVSNLLGVICAIIGYNIPKNKKSN